MPNHVDSCLEIRGTVAEVEKILKAISGKEDDGKKMILTCQRIIPMPKTVFRGNLGAEEKKIHGSNNWYDWSIKNWGTKWDVYGLSGKKYAPQNAEQFILGETKSVARIYFQTAWSPISPVIAKLSEMFPKNEFKYAYIDEGDGFAGKEIYLAGDMIEDSEEKSVAKRFLCNEPKLLKGNNVVKLADDEDRVGF